MVPLPPGGRLLCAVSLRIVGSGFCPIWRGGRPRAMLAPDASVGIFILPLDIDATSSDMI